MTDYGYVIVLMGYNCKNQYIRRGVTMKSISPATTSKGDTVWVKIALSHTSGYYRNKHYFYYDTYLMMISVEKLF